MCQERIVEVIEALATNSVENVRILCFGSGKPAVGKRVLQRVNPGAHPNIKMFVDEQRLFFKEMALHRGVIRTFTWRRWANCLGCFSMFPHMFRGHIPILNAGDAWQQGGVFVVAAAGEPLFRLREESPGYPRLDWTAFVQAARALNPQPIGASTEEPKGRRVVAAQSSKSSSLSSTEDPRAPPG